LTRRCSCAVFQIFSAEICILCRHYPNSSVYSLRHITGLLSCAAHQSTVQRAVIQAKISHVCFKPPSGPELGLFKSLILSFLNTKKSPSLQSSGCNALVLLNRHELRQRF